MYEMSQRQPVWVAENHVKPCNSVGINKVITKCLKNISLVVLCHSYKNCGLNRAKMAMICTGTANLPNSPEAGIIKKIYVYR
jgi:hypothetical protein